MKKVLTKLIAATLTIGLVGCANMSQKETVGTATGAVAGGIIGSAIGGGTGRLVAVGAGAVIGALIGGSIGRSMDESDQARVYDSINTGRTTTWENMHTHTTYRVTPTHYVTYNGNPHCRRYTTTAIMSGHRETVHGVACQRTDGVWEIVR